MSCPRWLPLEANPDVMNQFMQQLGVLPTWQFGDVFGMDPELLSLVPRPVCSILLLFPVTEKYETFKQEEEAKIKAEGQKVNPHVYFMKQTISNACGTIGLIHALANNQDKLEFESGSVMKKFLEDSASLTPEEKAQYLEKDESIRVTHEYSAQEGQTEAPGIDEKVDLHFISFVNIDGHLYELDSGHNIWVSAIGSQDVGMSRNTTLVISENFVKPCEREQQCMGMQSLLMSWKHASAGYQVVKVVELFTQEHCKNIIPHLLNYRIIHSMEYTPSQWLNEALRYATDDGRKPFPINHGDTTADSLLEDAIEVCKKFMQRDPDELRFTVMALYKI